MKGFVINIEKAAEENNNFRKVLYTAKNSQLVLMSLLPNEDIGQEVHDLDQFIRVEQGRGKAVLNGIEHEIQDGSAVVIPAGVRHNVINTSINEPMSLYTIYSPPEHRDGIVHISKQDAMRDQKDEYSGPTEK